MEFIKFEELLDIKDISDLNDRLCEKNVCCNKVMCFFNEKKGIVIKEMRKSFNFGKDSCVVDEVKDIFGIRKIGMYRVKSDKKVSRINCKKLEWENNMKYTEDKNVVYLVMNRFENIGNLGIHEDRETNTLVKLEYLKIILYRGIFRVSDGNYRNVLMNEKKELMSIILYMA